MIKSTGYSLSTYGCKLFKDFETGFANLVEDLKADLMSHHLSNHNCVTQTILADYCTSKIGHQV